MTRVNALMPWGSTAVKQAFGATFELDIREDNTMNKEILGNNPLGLPFSPAVAAGGFVFVSGQMAFDPDNKIIDGDITEQTRQTLDNIKRVLADAGLGMEDIAKNTIWLTRVEDFTAFNQAYAEYFSDNPPARATVRADLLLPGALIEIEALAYRG